MSKKRIWVLCMIVVVILGIMATVHMMFNGTPWGRTKAEKELMKSLHQEYAGLKFHQVGSVGYDFKFYYYDVGITFDNIPHVVYYFKMKNEKAFFVGIGGKYKPTKQHPFAPAPVPYSTSWIPTSK